MHSDPSDHAAVHNVAGEQALDLALENLRQASSECLATLERLVDRVAQQLGHEIALRGGGGVDIA